MVLLNFWVQKHIFISIPIPHINRTKFQMWFFLFKNKFFVLILNIKYYSSLIFINWNKNQWFIPTKVGIGSTFVMLILSMLGYLVFFGKQSIISILTLNKFWLVFEVWVWIWLFKIFNLKFNFSSNTFFQVQIWTPVPCTHYTLPQD